MKIDIDMNEKYEELTVIIQTPKMDQSVTRILEKLNQESQRRGPISGKADNKIYILRPNEIELFYSLSGKVFAQTKEQTLEIKQTLYSLEEKLQDTSFIRISKSAIANVSKIKNIEVSFNGSLVVRFFSGANEIISRRFVQKFKKFINIGGNE